MGHFDNNDSVIIENNSFVTENDPGLFYSSYAPVQHT